MNQVTGFKLHMCGAVSQRTMIPPGDGQQTLLTVTNLSAMPGLIALGDQNVIVVNNLPPGGQPTQADIDNTTFTATPDANDITQIGKLGSTLLLDAMATLGLRISWAPGNAPTHIAAMATAADAPVLIAIAVGN